MESELSANGETKLSDLAYRRFKEALFQKRIAAGAIVSQAHLVAITGVPITPLRDAMQVLQSEGIIQILPRSGIKIAKPDLALLRNAFQMRQILEVPALRHVAEAMPKHDLKALESKHQALLKGAPGTAMTRERATAVEAVDHSMHHAFIRFMDNPLLERAYRQAHDSIRLIRADRLTVLSTSALTRTMEEHLAIIRACLARDADAAQAALELHFARAIQRALGL